MRNNFKLPIFSIILLWITTLVECNISIIGPDSLKEAVNDLDKKEISINIANFGSVPYGKSLIGKVYMANPKQGCTNFNFTQKEEGGKKGAPIIIAERGGCSFVEKAHFAQMAGAKLLIIADDHVEQTSSIIMVEDGFGDIINIPVVMISKTEGSLIFKELESDNRVEIKIYFETPEKEQNVKLTFFLNIENRDSYRMVRDFKGVTKDLGSRVLFQPHYQVYQEDTSNLLQLQNENNCLGNSLYCMSDPDGDGKGTGRDILKEIIRQLCIYQNNQQKWWEYMDLFDQQCVKATTSRDCGENLEKKLGINVQKTNDCILKSIMIDDEQSIKEINEDNIMQFLIKYDNQLLKQERKTNQNIYYWPAVMISNQSYRGNLDRYDILEAICSAMKDPHSKCKEVSQGLGYGYEQSGNNNGSISTIILIVILILIVFFFFMIYVYKRMAKRELSREMSSQVNQMVSQYIAFYETRDKKQSNI